MTIMGGYGGGGGGWKIEWTWVYMKPENLEMGIQYSKSGCEHLSSLCKGSP